MINQFLFGLIQGIFEWLPVSSEGMLVLVMSNLLSISNVSDLIKNVLLLHLGTVLAASIYFRKDILTVFKNKPFLKFLIISTLISGIVGLFLYKLLDNFSYLFVNSKYVNLFVASLLFITGYILLKSKKLGLRKINNLNLKDGIILGILQGLAILPGLSRSGLTISGLLLRKFDDEDSLKISFIMSIPAILLGNVFLGLSGFIFTYELLIGFFVSFLVGYITIDILLKFAKKVNFSYFVFIFAILVLLSTFVA